jgi:hypothetical protein
MRSAFAAFSGLLFGLGLICSGMTNPSKVKGFLDVFGSWDPSLAFVMAAAIAVGAFAFSAAKRRTRSWSGELMELPTLKVVDPRLILGGVLFGAGWGIGGFCPGPALVAMGAGSSAAWIFGIAMLAGMLLHDRLFSASR